MKILKALSFDIELHLCQVSNNELLPTLIVYFLKVGNVVYFLRPIILQWNTPPPYSSHMKLICNSLQINYEIHNIQNIVIISLSNSSNHVPKHKIGLSKASLVYTAQQIYHFSDKR